MRSKRKLVISALILLGGLIADGQDNGVDFDFTFNYDAVTGTPVQADGLIDDLTSDGLMDEDEWAKKGSTSPLDIAFFVVYTIVTFFGLIGNVIVFFIIVAGNEIGKTVTTIYVLQLTIADTIFLLTLPIFSAQKLNAFNTWSFGEGMCTISQTIQYCNYYAGMFFLTVMSIDRYIALMYNSKLNQMRTKKKTYVVCAIVWILACLMSIPIMMYARIEINSGLKYCRVMFPGYVQGDISTTALFGSNEDDGGAFFLGIADGFDNESYANDQLDLPNEYVDPTKSSTATYLCQYEFQSQVYKTWLVFDALIAFIIPFAVIVAMYTLIMIHMKRVALNVAHARRGSVRNKRLTKIVAALVSCFAICWFPHHILSLARIPGFPSTMPICHGLEEFFTALGFSNSALNPMLYTFLGFKCKERFKASAHNVRTSIIKRQGSRGNSYYRSSRYNLGEEVTNQTKRDTTVV